MIETFALLLLAHTSADFILQPETMSRRKKYPGPAVDHTHGMWAAAFSGHILIVWLTMAAIFGQPLSWEICAIAAAHAALDLVKAFTPWKLWAFLADQGSHLTTLVIAALLFPDLWTAAPWSAEASWAPSVAVLISGAILAIPAGRFAVQLCLESALPTVNEEVNDLGKQVGLFERFLVFALLLINAPTAIGFLFAAKTFSERFRENNPDWFSSYVLLGTLASFSWALLVAFVTKALLSQLPLLVWLTAFTI